MQGEIEIQKLELEKEKFEISKLLEVNKRIEQENQKKKLELEHEQLKFKRKELEDMKNAIHNTKTVSIANERMEFNNNPIHLPINENIMHNFTICVWFRTSQPNAGIAAIYDKE